MSVILILKLILMMSNWIKREKIWFFWMLLSLVWYYDGCELTRSDIRTSKIFWTMKNFFFRLKYSWNKNQIEWPGILEIGNHAQVIITTWKSFCSSLDHRTWCTVHQYFRIKFRFQMKPKEFESKQYDMCIILVE